MRNFQYWVYDLNTGMGKYAVNGETLDKIIQELSTSIEFEDIGIEAIYIGEYASE